MSDIDQRLTELGLILPKVVAPRGSFAPYVRHGGLIYLSGKGLPLREAGQPVPKVGAGISTEEGRQFAREVGLQMLAVMREALGGFERFDRLIKVFGMVNAAPDFTGHTEVINGASDLFVEVLGERGMHARSAVGVSSLPRGFAVEIEAVIAER